MDLSKFITSPVLVLWLLAVVFGILFLWKVLSHFFKTRVVLLTVSLILFGTNYFWLVVFARPTANVFLFTLFLLIIMLTIVWLKEMKWIPLIAMLPVMILISALSEPGMFILLFPGLLCMQDKGSGENKRFTFRACKGQLLFLAGIFIGCFVLRQFSWFIGTGEDFYYGNATKGQFPLVPANIHRVLFSVKNGWLIYTPLVIFAFCGFFFLAEKNRVLFYPAFLFLLAFLITAGSNPEWWFKNGFGYPNLTETYALLCLPLGYIIEWSWNRNRKTRILLFVLSGLMIALNLFQTWQFNKSILLPERMTGKYFCATFGKTTSTIRDKMLLEPPANGLTDSVPAEPWVGCSRLVFYDFEKRMDDGEPFRLERAAHSGKYGMLLNPERRFSPGLNMLIRRLTDHDSSWISTTGYVHFDCKNAVNKVYLVITCTHQGIPYKYRVTNLMEDKFRPHQWNKVVMSYLVPYQVDPGDFLQVYFMNYGGEECYIDDFEINLCKSTR